MLLVCDFDPELDFRHVMAARCPENAFSCLHGDTVGGAPLGARAWATAMGIALDIPPPVSDGELARALRAAGHIALPEANHAALDRIRTALAGQLGGPWTGLEDLSAPRRLALAALGRCARGEGAGAARAVNAVACAARDGRIDEAAARHLIGELEDDALRLAVERHARGHAFAATVLLAAITEAKRTPGIMPNAWFLWLAPLDREAWLLLSGHGRPDRFVETLGAVAHYEAECALGHGLATPHLHAAAESVLRAAVTES